MDNFKIIFLGGGYPVNVKPDMMDLPMILEEFALH